MKSYFAACNQNIASNTDLIKTAIRGGYPGYNALHDITMLFHLQKRSNA